MQNLDLLPSDRLFVGGAWQTGRGAPITSVFPHDGSINRVIHGASRADLDAAIDRAREAQRAASWRGLKAHERATLLYRIAEGIGQSIEQIAFIQSRDTGKSLSETRALALSAAGTFRYMAAALETLDDTLTSPRGDYLTLSVHEPMGVIAAITPWNSPIASDAQKLAPALAAGNAVILKPASWSPLTALFLAGILERCGVPNGIVSILPGAGADIGDPLVEHPAIAKVAFTGGTEIGRRIALKSAQKLAPVSLELGGKSPSIVFDDCDEDLAISGILFGMFSSTGQSCIAGSRLFVQSTIYERFVVRLVAATRALRVGHPFDAGTQVAPLIRTAHRDAVERHVASAREDGGDVLCGGARPDDVQLSQGSYYLPTIIAGLDNTARLCRDEVFGPVLAVLPFADETDVVQQANANSFGLAAGIWTRDVTKAWRVGRAVEAGTVWINTYKQFSIGTPFGGVKDSGLGREKGREGIRAYQHQKSIYLDTSGRPHPWAASTVQQTLRGAS